MKKFIMTSVCLSLYTISAPAIQASEETQTRKVSYSDLDLTSDAGRDALHRRIGRAVSAVCSVDDTRDLIAMTKRDRCVRDAWASTRTQVAIAMLSAKRRLASVSGDGPQSVRVEMRR
jgi:UrcA family protein